MTRDEIAQRLERYGVLPTAQRLDVGEVILSSPQHASADQIIARIRERGSKASKATVYNTLNLFCERGLLRTVHVDPSRQYYDPTIEPHHHFYNVDTRELTDIDPNAIDLQIKMPLPEGTERAGVEVIIRVRDSRDPTVPRHASHAAARTPGWGCASPARITRSGPANVARGGGEGEGGEGNSTVSSERSHVRKAGEEREKRA